MNELKYYFIKQYLFKNSKIQKNKFLNKKV